MGRIAKTCKVKWIHLVLFGASFLRLMMREAGYFLEEGVVIVLDDDLQAKQFVSNLVFASGGVFRSTNAWKQRKRPKIFNYCGCFFPISKQTSDGEIEEFLTEKEFFPIIVCGGVLPNCARSHTYIFRLGKEDVLESRMEALKEEFGEWKRFVVKNSQLVYQTILQVERSMAAEHAAEFGEYKSAFLFFACIERIYSLYLSTFKTEREVVDFSKAFMCEAGKSIGMFTEFHTTDLLQEAFRNKVWEYISSHQEVKIIDIENVDGKAYEIIQKKQGILFDRKYYYFPNILFEVICEPLLVTLSIPELKLRMKEEGLMFCNSVDFTVKKQFTTVSGITERLRVLRIEKEKLMSEENLLLEDIYYHNDAKGDERNELYW